MPDLDPPPITISNPASAPDTLDLLLAGSERQLWRPSRRLLTLIGLTALLVAGVTVPTVLLVEHHSTEQVQRKELGEVSLHAVDDPSDQGGTDGVLLNLNNDGSQQLSVLAVKIDREGYPTQKTPGVALRPHSGGIVVVKLIAGCPDPLPSGSPTGLLVTVRTPSRGVKTVRLPLVGIAFADSYEQALNNRCGGEPDTDTEPGFTGTSPADTSTFLLGTLGGFNRTGRSLHATAVLANPSPEPVVIRLVSGAGGLHAAAAYPIQVPGNTVHGSVPVVLTVESCEVAKAAYGRPSTVAFQPLTLLGQGGGQTVFSQPTLTPAGEKALTAFVASLC